MKYLSILFFFIVGLFLIYMHYYSVFISLSILAFILIVNQYLRSRLYRNYSSQTIFYMKDTRRNFDKLIIGDVKKTRNNSSELILSEKRMSFFTCYLYLIHYYSYLKEGGEVILYPSNNNQFEVTLQDLYYFHPVIRERLGVHNYYTRIRFPIIYIFMKIDGRQYNTNFLRENLEDSINVFCKERNITVKIFNNE